ncbi:MAG: hypothetical protein GY801_14035 [bacterium]|nr:hypothetical protein [bacterium]
MALDQSLIEDLSIVRKLFQEVKNSFGLLFLEGVIGAQKFHNIYRKFDDYSNETKS